MFHFNIVWVVLFDKDWIEPMSFFLNALIQLIGVSFIVMLLTTMKWYRLKRSANGYVVIEDYMLLFELEHC